MSDHVVPHFHNDAGVPVIEIGSQEFMCVGANPPIPAPAMKIVRETATPIR